MEIIRLNNLKSSCFFALISAKFVFLGISFEYPPKGPYIFSLENTICDLPPLHRSVI